MDIKRNILAVILVGIVILITPAYLKWITPAGLSPAMLEEDENQDHPQKPSVNGGIKQVPVIENNKTGVAQKPERERLLFVETDLYSLTLSNSAGGSVYQYKLKSFKGSYDGFGDYVPSAPVMLVEREGRSCTPCIGLFDRDEQDYELINGFFMTAYEPNDTIYISPDDSIEVLSELDLGSGKKIVKNTVYYGNKYLSQHDYRLYGFEDTYRKNVELIWDKGLLPTEEKESEDNQNSAAIIYQSGEMDDLTIKKPDTIGRTIFEGNTDWVAIKNKYFIAALLPEKPGVYGTLSGNNALFGKREVTPEYRSSIGFPSNPGEINSKLYLGPQDYHLLGPAGESLEDAMNWGMKIIRPISKYLILNMLTFLHNPFGLFYINYGIVLILFAFVIRFVTGPLTKKSYVSNKKMQTIQPEVKKLQAKLKSSPQKMNQEVMALYKKHGVNPLGGCLPILIQMPLLLALFTVFRNTIEFRGAEFFWWIKDLSKPDVIFTLPFNIPIYGNGVAILPIIMGITMFLQQRLTSSSMDKSQKPMMYMMSGFFFLLFNQFPSGLNLYYAMLNILNILQQRSVKVT